ncbi:MAG: methylated-DNA--[protein]-cysteine S-methyltransferase [Thermoflavifilum sp.]|nr:methylated-DNA--[protein]-cysteine S-methyltransferase [Thermoflavifilum sp.]MCL6514208.1 methylated-DNA--[protein]-cysteine S-methyltransferase [Alicyclobacillus sp.]
MEYALGERTTFTVPLAPTAGTPFQQRVWAALREIPYGETRTYAEIAAAAGNPRAVRAVGQANRANPVAVIIPCHRVIGARGDLVGYDGKRVHIKARLLALEGALPGEAAVSGGV